MPSPPGAGAGVFAARFARFWVFASLFLVVDLASKEWIAARIPYGTYLGSGAGGPVVVVPGFFQIVHIGNEGAAWGLLAGHRMFLSLVAIGALAAIFFFHRTLELWRPVNQIAFGMMVAGILGNLIDRAVHGHVVDFLDFTLPAIPALGFGGYRWPAFNFADVGICAGVILYLLASFFPAKKT